MIPGGTLKILSQRLGLLRTGTMTQPISRPFSNARPTLGLAFAFLFMQTAPILAQPMSSGSGAGTGTGMSGGAPRNSTGTGQESGGRNATGTGTESGSSIRFPGANNYFGPSRGRNLISPDRNGRGGSIPAGPGVSGSLPGENAVPLGAMAGYSDDGSHPEYTSISDVHMRYALAIPAPGDRSLALSRIASAATFNNQLPMADKALGDASAAALEMPAGLVRDQRLISIVMSLLYLGEAHLREGRTDLVIPDPSDTPDALPKLNRADLIRNAQTVILRAADLAGQIGNPTYRSEYLYRVADGLAYDSQSIVNEFPKTENAPPRDTNASVLNDSYDSLPDQMLQQAAAIAERIDRPVWHDRGLVAVASAAAESRQFARALLVARKIPQPEVRTDALLKIAEIQARRGDGANATATYREAAEAVASIPLDDPRAVLAGVLIDNLISVGRFDDARKSVTLYPDQSRRLVALGAIAESQGRRGSANQAIAWINNDVPAPYRSTLYRRVSNGVVAAIENNRTRDLSSRNER